VACDDKTRFSRRKISTGQPWDEPGNDGLG
jgi:hypothetical protein